MCSFEIDHVEINAFTLSKNLLTYILWLHRVTLPISGWVEIRTPESSFPMPRPDQSCRAWVPKWWCKRRGAEGESAPPNILICWNPENIPENPGKNGALRCLTSKNGAQRLQKSTWILVLKVTPKRVLYGRTFVGKSHTKLFGQKFARSKICLLLHLCSVAGQKYFCRGGQKRAKSYFHHS